MQGHTVPQTPRLRIGWNVPGTMTRLGLHMGMILAWCRYFPTHLPDLVVATSAGAILMSCCITFDRAVLRRVRRVVKNLKREQIYVMSKGLVNTGFLLVAAGGTLVITAVSAGSLGWFWAVIVLALAGLYAVARVRTSRLYHWPARLLIVAVAGVAAWRVSYGLPSAILFCAGLFMFELLLERSLGVFLKEVGSPFDNTPLRKLLLDQDVPRMAFLAKTELRILAADVEGPGPIWYSNHEPLMCDPQNPEHGEQFVDGILGSSALPGRFPLRRLRSKTPRDGEVWTDFPIEEFKGVADIVFRFDYWSPLQPGPSPKHWLPAPRPRRPHHQEKMEKYELQRHEDPSLPRVIPIRASKRLAAQIPELAVYSFKPGQLARSIMLGMRIIRENRDLIRRELGIPNGDVVS